MRPIARKYDLKEHAYLRVEPTPDHGSRAPPPTFAGAHFRLRRDEGKDETTTVPTWPPWYRRWSASWGDVDDAVAALSAG